jgi:hypothetical protein
MTNNFCALVGDEIPTFSLFIERLRQIQPINSMEAARQNSHNLYWGYLLLLNLS